MPTPKARTVELSDRVKDQLQFIIRRQKSSQRQLRRAHIMLKAAAGTTNENIATDLNISRSTVKQWRARFAAANTELTSTREQLNDDELRDFIETLLSDAPRSGMPPRFSAEQVLQVIALACETPADSAQPSSHWTAKELATEAVKRGIVTSISVQSVARFLKRSGPQTAPQPLLAQPPPG